MSEESKNANATKIIVKKIPKINNSKNKKRKLGSFKNKKKPGIPRPKTNPMDKEIVIPKNFPKNNDFRLTDLDNKTSAKGIDSKKDIEYKGMTMSVRFIVLTSNRIPFWSPKKLNTIITNTKRPE
jgi:hypothetical protein